MGPHSLVHLAHESEKCRQPRTFLVKPSVAAMRHQRAAAVGTGLNGIWIGLSSDDVMSEPEHVPLP